MAIEKLLKEQIVIELLEAEQVTPEEAALLLDRTGRVELRTTYELEYIEGEEVEVKEHYWTTTST